MLATSAAAFAFAATPAAAQSGAAAQREFDIPSLPLNEALRLFMRQSGVQVSYASGDGANVRTTAVRGNLTPAAALNQLLAGTGLTYRFAAPTSVVLEPAPPSADGAIRLGPVRVEGASGGGAGSGSASRIERATTEGTGSYTTRAVTIGKSAVSLRETPQSVTVVTRQRLDEQNVTEVGQAFDFVTGITTEPVSHSPGNYLGYARGNNVTFQVDGNQQSSLNTSLFDTAIYDRIEVMRGVAGLLSGGRLDGATANLVRKRPQAEPRLGGSLGMGTYGKHREMLDLTGALTASKALSGRLILVNEDVGDWHDYSYGKKWLVDGSLAWELGANTTLLLGGTFQRQKFNGGISIPTFADGSFPDVSRTIAIAAPWGRTIRETSDVFAALEHDLEGGGLIKITARRTEYDMDQNRISLRDPMADDGTVRLYNSNTQSDTVTKSIDGFVDLPFQFLGHDQKLLAGFDASRSVSDSYGKTTPDAAWPGRLNIFDMNPNSLVEPDWSDPRHTLRDNRSITESYGAYGSLRLKLLDSLTLIAGGRLSWWETSSLNRQTLATSGYKVNAKFTPYGGLVFDLDDSLSLYVSIGAQTGTGIGAQWGTRV